MTFPIWYFLFDKEVIHSKWNISSRNILSNSAHEWKYCHKVWIYSLFYWNEFVFCVLTWAWSTKPWFSYDCPNFSDRLRYGDDLVIARFCSSESPLIVLVLIVWKLSRILRAIRKIEQKVMLSCLKGVHTVIIACLMVIVTGQVLLAGRFLFLFLFLFVSHVMLQISQNRKWRKRDSRTKCSITPCLIISTVPW